MKFAIVTAFLVASVSAVPVRRDVDPNLVPQFGHAAGLNPTGTGNCDGINGPNGKPIAVPCACPPDEASFIASLNANVAAGHAVNNPSIAVSFPSDNSKGSQLARIDAALVTLQNLHGPGVGCPASSTTFVAQQAAILAEPAGGAPPPPPPPPPPPSPPAAPPAPPAAPPASPSIASLVPQLGVTAGANPDGNGNCDGINGPSGQPIKIPCACPPSQADFDAAVAANVAAGHAINNPNVPFSFPLDSSKASQVSRVQAAIVTLQNLHGPGVGCPASSSTFSAQLKAALAA